MSRRRGIYETSSVSVYRVLAKVNEEGRVWYVSKYDHLDEPAYHDDVAEILDLFIPYELYEGV